MDEITILYKEFIYNFKRLTQVFDLNNPIEIYAIYIYLLERLL